ncbi:DNA-binding SARP family transcriptional activator [Actinoplanes lutulentus]|uniref:DNA-binding SARP family transcriptional activator n=1 Tax=Actinoplanes lutulentus TaxID=1287878 RepID=A0A327Z1P9_9ACTN|nr:BTAD domain-containing putative transcriptional regulator [Actinoplanes lutulentus]MBB2943253.1 DNA-binding SARP family transcriptional activator [Actinoplanes lutulentus]RAK28314.1 DNA-binding SARP family transcriptional activator [Actinoplanes lutulentus]
MVRAFVTLGRLVRALVAAAMLLGFAAGVPWLLIASAGWPLDWIGWVKLGVPPGVSDLVVTITSPWSDQMIVALLASIGWVLWVQFVRDTVIEVIEASATAAAARHGRLRPPVAGRGPIRWVAAMLVGAILGGLLFDVGRTASIGGGSAAADAAAHRPAIAVAPAQAVSVSMTVPRTHSAIVVAAATARPLSAHRDNDIPAWARDAPGGVHHVVEHDNLWDIAEHKLGDAHRWREIYKLNRGHEQVNGHALRDPDEIHVGWVLALPTHGDSPARQKPATPSGASTEPDSATEEKPSTDAPPRTASPLPVIPAPNGTVSPAPVDSSPAATFPRPPGAISSAQPAASSSMTAGSEATSATAPNDNGHDRDEAGIALPTQGWVSLGLAALLAAVASLVRLQRRRRARLTFPVPARLEPQPAPLPESLTPIEAAADRRLRSDPGQQQPSVPAVAAPIGVDANAREVSLFDLPGSGLALHGDGAEAATRALLAAVLASGAIQSFEARPIVVTTTEVLTRLLPDGAPLLGLDPDGTSYDGERLIVLSDTAAAVTHAEEEMILRRRLLDTFDADSITALNARTDHAETQPAYVLLIEASPRHVPRLLAVGAHRTALHLHPVVFGEVEGLIAFEVTADGTIDEQPLGLRRLSTLAATGLAAVLAALADTTPRPAPGHDIDTPAQANKQVTTASGPSPNEASEPAPAQTAEVTAPVRLHVLGPVRITTDTGPVTTGMRSGSYTVLASLAAYSAGRSLEQLAADLHPDTDPATAAKRIRTDINTARRVLRNATGRTGEMFVVYDPGIGRYQIDARLFTVDLWQMLTALDHANKASDDAVALVMLREAADLYNGDFAEGQDRAWVTDYAGSYRHQILVAYARIAEIIEVDFPEQAIAALQRAVDLDPINEELYQRIMRIQGRVQHPDAVRQTLRRLEERLADLDAEPSEATRRVADRQLRPITSGGHR